VNWDVDIVDTGLLVFREGLEMILVLSAITASMMGANQTYRRPIAAGAGSGFLATVITWFIAVGILSSLTHSIPALDIQAGTGLLAIIVLLVIMNWFFHIDVSIAQMCIGQEACPMHINYRPCR
jgi:high-affinity iron transporter